MEEEEDEEEEGEEEGKWRHGLTPPPFTLDAVTHPDDALG